jgi:septum formation inhibitor MinC
MAHDMGHLKREIESLEKQLAELRFGSLFDRKRVDQLEDKLKKKRKEMARIIAGDDDDLDVAADHIDIPEIDVALVDAPDLDADFGAGLDHDEPTGMKHAAKSAGKPARSAAKAATKTVKKAASKPKPMTKPKAKSKPAPKKISVAKPAKKKSKR